MPKLTTTEGRKALAHRAGKQPEGIVLDQCRQYLRVLGWYVIRIQQGPLCHKGMSDLVCIKDGRVVFLEIKATKGKQSDKQIKFQAEIEFYGGRYLVARSLEDVMGL